MPNPPWELFNKSANSTTTSIGSSASDVRLLAANPSRKFFTVYNDSTQVLFLLLGGIADKQVGASTANYTVQIAANGYYEAPSGVLWLGEVRGIWFALNGAARITEFT